MFQAVLLIIAVLIIILLLFRRTREAAVGICAVALEQTVKRNANKEKALEFIREHGQASNEEIRLILGVSERSVVRYMDSLEREGKVEQVGATGRSVQYKIKA